MELGWGAASEDGKGVEDGSSHSTLIQSKWFGVSLVIPSPCGRFVSREVTCASGRILGNGERNTRTFSIASIFSTL